MIIPICLTIGVFSFGLGSDKLKQEVMSKRNSKKKDSTLTLLHISLILTQTNLKEHQIILSCLCC